MKKILLASHGTLSAGLKNTLNFFLGEDCSITDVNAYSEPGDEYLVQIQEFIDNSEDDESIIFTDIYGGSVNQQVTRLVISSKKNIPIITSMNLPIVLSIVLSSEKITQNTIQHLLTECAPKLVDISILSEDLDANDFYD